MLRSILATLKKCISNSLTIVEGFSHLYLWKTNNNIFYCWNSIVWFWTQFIPMIRLLHPEFLMTTVGNSTNIFWHECPVRQAERQKLLNQKGCVVWITGLSGSGQYSIYCARITFCFVNFRCLLLVFIGWFFSFCWFLFHSWFFGLCKYYASFKDLLVPIMGNN